MFSNAQARAACVSVPRRVVRAQASTNGPQESIPLISDRRAMLLVGAACLAPLMSAQASRAEGDMEVPKCRECAGAGVTPCDMCGGSGRWKALSRKRAKDTYEFVECPQCFGKAVRVRPKLLASCYIII